MKQSSWVMCKRRLTLAGAAGFLCQLGTCDLGEITTTSTTTVNGNELLVSLVRGAIITPLDLWLTDTLNDAFESDNE